MRKLIAVAAVSGSLTFGVAGAVGTAGSAGAAGPAGGSGRLVPMDRWSDRIDTEGNLRSM